MPRPRALSVAIGLGLTLASAHGGEPVREAEAPRVTGLAAGEAHPRSNYAWPYATGPRYGRVPRTLARSAGTLHTAVGSFRLGSGLPELPGPLSTAARAGGDQHYIVQLDPRLGGAKLLEDLLAERGRRVVGSMPVSAFVARLRLDDELLSRVRGLPGMLALLPYQAAFKLSPLLGRVPLLDPARARSDAYTLRIRVWDDDDPASVAAAVVDLGGSVEQIAINGTLRAVLHRSRLAELAQLDAVESVEEFLPGRPLDEKSAATLQTGRFRSGATPYLDAGIDGAGQILMVLDSGIQLDAADLSDTRAAAGIAGSDPGNASGGEHRKVLFYGTTDPFGGHGDLLGCDASISGGYTHGHLVAATALGNASRDLPPSYGEPYFASDAGSPEDTRAWSLVGVAPGAKLVFYDGQAVPAIGSCAEPLDSGIWAGTTYGGAPGTGSLGEAYTTHGARVFDFSWGSPSNSYSATAAEIDEFLYENPEALLFVAAGNGGDLDGDGVVDPGSLGEPATSKNALAIGASMAPTSLELSGAEEIRAAFSSVGPEASSGRIAPQLMAPGADGEASLGPASTYACTTADNDGADPVECELRSGVAGTSYAAAAAAGAALLVRDYLQDGWYPEGVQISPANDVGVVSGALVKALLVASADFLDDDGSATEKLRPNDLQGWGRIRLDRVLPLQRWVESPSGLLVVDGDGDAPNLLGGTIDGDLDAMSGETQTATFEVCGTQEELRLALVWVEREGVGGNGAIVNDLDLGLESPSGKIYQGNYFTDDDDRDGFTDPTTEDCPGVGGATGFRDASEWSLPVCTHGDLSVPPFDGINPIEMIVLSPDYDGDGAGDAQPDDDNQLEAGSWTVTVQSAGGGDDADQDYALVVSGAVCRGSSVRLDKTRYRCNGAPRIAVTERDDPGVDDASALDPAVIAGRTVVAVFDAQGVEVDAEALSSVGFAQPDPGELRFVSDPVVATDRTARDPGNGVLDVRSGDTITAIYTDTTSTGPVERRSSARVDCRVDLSVNVMRIAQFGMDDNLLVRGGCEQNARGQFETGAPDRYLDAGERIILDYGFTSNEPSTLTDATARLRCVLPDGNSPAGCAPNSGDCADPDREDNPVCPQLTVTNNPVVIGRIPPDSSLSANFNIVMADAISGTVEAELVLEVRADVDGATKKGVSVRRVTLNADESSTYYSTDYPSGGTELQDRDDDERIEDPLSAVETTLRDDLRFETVTYSPIFGTSGSKNLNLQSPWFFDLNDGGFTSGLNARTDFAEVTAPVRNWGEDLNFNNQLDWHCSLDPALVLPGGQPGCDPDNDQCGASGAGVCDAVEDADIETGANGVLDQNWGTTGGCGWQTRAPGTCSAGSEPCYVDDDCPPAGTRMCNLGVPQATGGIWHTGTIGGTTGTCTLAGGNDGQCQLYETIGGEGLEWIELLLTPTVQRVGEADATVEITNWAWNAAVDLADQNASYLWQLDNDTGRSEPFDPLADTRGYFETTGAFGARTEGGDYVPHRGFPLFAPMSPSGAISLNGSVGHNRAGKNSCYFESRLFDEALDNVEFCQQNYHHGCFSRAHALAFDGLSDPSDDDLNNGVCSHDDRITCSKACSVDGAFSGDPDLGQFRRCNVDGDCPYSGSCIGRTADCATAEPCTVDADCTSGAGGVCIAYQGTCAAGSQYEGNPCVFNEECADNSLPVILQCNRTSPAPSKVCEYSCEVSGTEVDEYVTPAGPLRNHDLQVAGGPDLRFETLEDELGPTGEFFRGAIGFRLRSKPPTAPLGVPGYGLGVDDMVVEWREFTLVEDATDCTPAGGAGNGGACASLDVASAGFFEGSSLLTVTVLDSSPTGNDCDGDGAPDVPEDFDCDDDGTPDVIVRVKSLAEPSGETVTADRTADPCACEYVGVLPISARHDSAGVLFLQQTGPDPLTVTLTYEDRDDGTGRPCTASADPAQQGLLLATLEVRLLAGNVVVGMASLLDGETAETHGDQDGFADGNETVAMRIAVTNRTGVPLQGVTARLSTNDPRIDCVLRAEIPVGDIPATNPADPGTDPTVLSGGSFLFRVADAQRTGTCSVSATTCVLDADCPATELCSASLEPFTAEFSVTISSRDESGIDTTLAPQTVRLDLDLDAAGGSDPGVYTEDFESGGFNSFTTENLDLNLGSNLEADGYRCQYTDPLRFPCCEDSALKCWPGAGGSREDYWWRINSADPNAPSPDGGRAYSGTRSL